LDKEEDEESGPMGSETVRYELSWLRKRGSFEKKLATLFVLRGADTGLRIPMAKRSVTLGRTIEADLVFHDEQISRKHATISYDLESDTYYLLDLGSTNGTFLNDQPVTRAELKDGDKIFLGGTILKFMIQDEVESASGEMVDRLMFQDDLTGLVVKRRFYNELELRILAANVQTSPLSVLMMDMDGLKKVNDTHGHLMGAFIISESGKLIGELCNQNGQACRYGGDEFIAYSLGSPKAQALDLGELIRRTIREHAFVKDGVSSHMSISIGVSTLPEDGKTLEVLVRAADEALYRAKAKGRDKVSD
jgi:diguanylate cyclase (GGDEF)-like protein